MRGLGRRSLPVPRMFTSPSADTFHLIGAFEVALVLRFGAPPSLSLAFAFSATDPLPAKALVMAITSIGKEKAFAMQTFTKASGHRHSGGKKSHRAAAAHAKEPRFDPLWKKIDEQNGGRRKKKFS